MITFLPRKDFIKTASELDSKRLLSQINEARIILSKKWPYHPATLMWANYPSALKSYINALLFEWTCRGHKLIGNLYRLPSIVKLPDWFDNPLIFISHQVRLVFKKTEHYQPLFNIPDIQYPPGYYWPICHGKKATDDSTQWRRFEQQYKGILPTFNI